MITTVTKHVGYVPAMHHLPNHDGLCRNPHGHNYEVEVEVSAEVLVGVRGAPDEGMVIDFSRISDAWARIKPLWDHQDLNTVLNFGTQAATHYRPLAGPTTAENLAAWLFDAFIVENVPVSAVTLYETPTSSARVSA